MSATARLVPQLRMQRRIVNFHQDEFEDWVAKLECGHAQHVRHNPPWVNRPWVVTHEGRDSMIGVELDCKVCDAQNPPPHDPAHAR